MKVKQYRKKPVIVSAIQFTGDNFDEIQAFTGKAKFRPAVREESQETDPRIVTEVYDTIHDTWLGVFVGNYIVQGVRGEFYPHDERFFFEVYEEVT